MFPCDSLVKCWLSTTYYLMPFIHVPSFLSDYANPVKWDCGFGSFIVAICCLTSRHVDGQYGRFLFCITRLRAPHSQTCEFAPTPTTRFLPAQIILNSSHDYGHSQGQTAQLSIPSNRFSYVLCTRLGWVNCPVGWRCSPKRSHYV